VRRYLQWRGYNVQYVQNFTDIDDKILNRARLEGSSMEAWLSAFQAYFEDMARLNIKEADAYPRTHTWMGLSGWCTSWNKKCLPSGGMSTRCGSLRSMATFGRKLEDATGASGQVPAVRSPSAQRRLA